MTHIVSYGITILDTKCDRIIWDSGSIIAVLQQNKSHVQVKSGEIYDTKCVVKNKIESMFDICIIGYMIRKVKEITGNLYNH